MRRLYEWQDANGKKVSTSSSTQSSTKPSGGSTKRFGKLLNYHIAHKDKDVDKIIQKEINPYGFTYAEHHTDGIGGYTKKVKVLMNAHGDWTFSVFMDDKEIAQKTGKGWDTFVWEISFYLALPEVTTDPEYQDLLEWVDSKGKKVGHSTSTTPATTSNTSTNKSFKKRLDRLVTYYGQHLPAEVDYITVNLLTPGSLNFTEHCNDGDKLNYDIFLDDFATVEWRIKYSVNGKLVDDLSGTGWPELLNTLGAGYIEVPAMGTPEYNDLLTEWLDTKGNKINLNNSQTKTKSTVSPPDQTYRYKRLLAQIDSDGLFRKHIINVLDERTLDVTLGNGVAVKLERQEHSPIYVLTVGNHSESYDDYEDVLSALIEEGIIGDTDLCESASFADDFKTYENLWN